MLTTVMNDVRAPEPAHAVARPVFPVIDEILRHERQQDDGQAHAQIKKAELPDPHQESETDKSEQNIGDQVAQPHRHGGESAGLSAMITCQFQQAVAN